MTKFDGSFLSAIRLSRTASLALMAVAFGAGCGSQLGLAEDESPLTGLTRNLQPTPLQPVWRKVLYEDSLTDTPRKELSRVAYSATIDRLAVGTHNGWLYCYRASDGDLQWRRRVGGDARATFDGDQLLVGTSDGRLVAIDIDTGMENWAYRVQGAVDQPPVVGGDLVYFVDGTNAIYAVNRQSGEWKWQYRREQPAEFALAGEATPTYDGSRIYMGFSDGFLVALSALDGAITWKRNLAPNHQRFLDIDAQPVLAGGILFAASASGGLYALDPLTGEIRWQKPVKGIVGMMGLDTDLIVSFDQAMVMRLSGTNGQVRWRTRYNPELGSGGLPVQVGDLLALTFSLGGLHFIDGISGRPVQRFNPGSGIQSPPTSGPDGSLFMISNGAVLYAFQTKTRS